MWGVYFDTAWHRTIGRDSFWALPHLFIYGGGFVVWIADVSAIALATRGRLVDLGGTVLRAGPLRLPLGFALSALGTAVIVLAVPTDLTWHAVFGKDLLIWSPPHLQGVVDPNQDRVPGPGDPQARRPLPQYGGFTAITNIASSNYNSLQVKAEKRATHGLYLLSAFTYSKAINDLPEICCAAPFAQNSYDLAAERGRADFDQTLRWVLSFDYEVPFGKQGSRFSDGVVEAVLGGWHLGGIYTLARGFPFSPYLGFDPSNTGTQGIVRPNQLRDGNLPRDQRTPNNWFDINAFAIPSGFSFGNAGRNVLTGPGQNVFDWLLSKQFRLTERQRLEFRAEFFNAFNHPNFAQPDNFIDDGPGSAGVITSLAIPMRQIQFGLKYSF